MSSQHDRNETGRDASPAPGAPPARGFGGAEVFYGMGTAFAVSNMIVLYTHSHTSLMLLSAACMFGGVFLTVRARKRTA